MTPFCRSKEPTAALDVVAAPLDAVGLPEDDALPDMVGALLEPVLVVLAADAEEFPEPEVAVAVYSVVVNEQDRTRSFASGYGQLGVFLERLLMQSRDIPLSLPSLLYFEIQASHSGRLFAARGSLQMQFSSAVSSSLVFLSQEEVKLTTGAQTSWH